MMVAAICSTAEASDTGRQQRQAHAIEQCRQKTGQHGPIDVQQRSDRQAITVGRQAMHHQTVQVQQQQQQQQQRPRQYKQQQDQQQEQPQ